MANVTPQRIGSRIFVKNYDHDPGATTAILASPDGGTTPVYLDMSLFAYGAASYRPTIIGGAGVTLMRAFASSDIAGATNATLIRSSGAVAGDSLNDTVFVEWTADEIAALDTSAVGLRYVTIELTHGTNTDEGNLTFVGVEPRFPRDALSATAIT